jgi:hypothetical protein
MKQSRSSGGLPPNFDSLPRELQVIIEEKWYEQQLRMSHACFPGDPRLTSMDPSGVEVPVGFGKRVQRDDDVEVDEREDHD